MANIKSTNINILQMFKSRLPLSVAYHHSDNGHTQYND